MRAAEEANEIPKVQLASVMPSGQIAIGLLGAAAIAFAARRAGALSTSGAVAATTVGSMTATAGWRWAALLILYFLTSSALSRLTRIPGDIVAKAGPRDARQVVANGGVFAVCAVLGETSAALGALAAATADTWSTEIGMRFGGTPRMLFTRQPVSAGTSGGISRIGSMAAFGGAIFIDLMAGSLRLSPALGAITFGGLIGAFSDSAIGATVQERRHCRGCDRPTERRVHACGMSTVHVGGVRGMDNDLVNLLATVVGAAVATVLPTS